MTRGRKPKPTAAKRAAGNPGKRKLPDEEQEPAAVEEVPEPPEWLDDMAADYWRRWAPELTRLRLLTVVDLPEFERLCANYGVWYRFYKEVRDQENLMHEIFAEYRRAGDALNKLAAQFGINPVSRAPLHTPKEEKRSAMQEHLEAVRAQKGIGPPPGQAANGADSSKTNGRKGKKKGS